MEFALILLKERLCPPLRINTDSSYYTGKRSKSQNSGVAASFSRPAAPETELTRRNINQEFTPCHGVSLNHADFRTSCPAPQRTAKRRRRTQIETNARDRRESRQSCGGDADTSCSNSTAKTVPKQKPASSPSEHTPWDARSGFTETALMNVWERG